MTFPIDKLIKYVHDKDSLDQLHTPFIFNNGYISIYSWREDEPIYKSVSKYISNITKVVDNFNSISDNFSHEYEKMIIDTENRDGYEGLEEMIEGTII